MSWSKVLAEPYRKRHRIVLRRRRHAQRRCPAIRGSKPVTADANGSHDSQTIE